MGNAVGGDGPADGAVADTGAEKDAPFITEAMNATELEIFSKDLKTQGAVAFAEALKDEHIASDPASLVVILTELVRTANFIQVESDALVKAGKMVKVTGLLTLTQTVVTVMRAYQPEAAPDSAGALEDGKAGEGDGGEDGGVDEGEEKGGKKGKKGKKGEKGKKEDGEKKGGGEDDGKDGKPNAFMAFFGQKEESKKDKKKNEKALELLVENLEMLQQLGCEFLSSVAKMSSLKYVVFRSRGVETILDAMRKFPKAHDVIWWGANALFFLCRDGAALQDDNILQLREEGADAVLATVVENYANDVTMVPHVQVLLRMLRTLDKLVVGEGHARIGGKVRFVGNEVLDEGAGAGQGGGGRQVFQRESEKPSYGGYR
jgi:hypothetical protein